MYHEYKKLMDFWKKKTNAREVNDDIIWINNCNSFWSYKINIVSLAIVSKYLHPYSIFSFFLRKSIVIHSSVDTNRTEIYVIQF